MSLSEDAIGRAVDKYRSGWRIVDIAADLGIGKRRVRAALVAAGEPIKARGFGALSTERRREMSALGGKAVPAERRPYARSADLARSSGSIGGMVKNHGVAHEGHHQSSMAEHRIWRGMILRCRDPSATGYHRYGGRGIRVCDRWLEFNNFFADMGSRPPGRSLDRVNNDGDYEPGNCRWATNSQQANNRSDTRYIEAFGERLTAAAWASRYGIAAPLIRSRLRYDWSPEEAVSLPVHQRGDTRKVHETRPALLAAQNERLRIGI